MENISSGTVPIMSPAVVRFEASEKRAVVRYAWLLRIFTLSQWLKWRGAAARELECDQDGHSREPALLGAYA
jgi:hypothetical protein